MFETSLLLKNLAFAGIGMVAGFMSYVLDEDNKGKFKWRMAALKAVNGGVFGAVVYNVCIGFDLPYHVAIGVSYVGGFLGPQGSIGLLLAIANRHGDGRKG